MAVAWGEAFVTQLQLVNSMTYACKVIEVVYLIILKNNSFFIAFSGHPSVPITRPFAAFSNAQNNI